MLRRTAVLMFALALGGGWLAAQTPPQKPPEKPRDLKYESGKAPAPAPAKVVAIPRSYALVVGIAKYENLPASAQLDDSERDAESIYSILISQEGGNFRAENVHRLIGSQATLANLKKELEVWLPSMAKPDDRVLIYFAGHGFVFNSKAYLAPYDLDPKNVAGTGYPMAELSDVVGNRIRAKWKVLLTDSCHSGAIAPDADARTLNNTLLDLNTSLFSLTASRDRERSFESKDWGGGHGIFTYYVVKGLEGEADENGDGVVTADELGDYVYRNVREATNGAQNPTWDRGSFDPSMLLAYIPSAIRAAHPPPPKDGTVVIVSNMDGVEVFIDGKSVGVVNKGTPLRLPGMLPGTHTIKGVKMGYEPDGPRDEMVYPGQETTISVKIMIARRRNKAAESLFDNGMEHYNKGYADNYRKAVDDFEKALAIDPAYSQAALYLGRAYNSLFEEQKSEAAMRRAIEIDPDYMEARVSLAGMLLDIGDSDESLRQLNVVTQREPADATAWYLLAEAYRMKGMYGQSIDAARKAIQLSPNIAEAHLWLAESLRLSGKYPESSQEYLSYLRLSDFDSKLAGKMNYYVVGFLVGMGKKKRAAQTDTWKDMRSLAYFGLCDSARKQKEYDSAIGFCQKSLTYDPTDPYVHYALALAYMHKADQTGSLEALAAARKHFHDMLNINSDIAEAQYAKQNLKNIDQVLQASR